MLRLKSRRGQLDDARYTARARTLESGLEQLINVGDPEPNAARIARRMKKHRNELTAFLWDPNLDGTNNAAGRALRPAVVARKISGGSRSPNGARAWAMLASLLRTAGQQGQRLLDTIKAMLAAAWSGERPPAVLAGQ